MKMRSLFRTVSSLFLFSLITACTPVQEAAPPVAALSGVPAGEAELLQQGRQIFLTDCTACHFAKNIAGYRREDWPDILWEMTERAELTAEETAAVTAYVYAVLDSAPAES